MGIICLRNLHGRLRRFCLKSASEVDREELTLNLFDVNSLASSDTICSLSGSGDYVLWGRTFSADGNDDSFYVQIDNG